jgi:prephenate dehydratase
MSAARLVGFQGAAGAYSEEAVYKACGADVEAIPLKENRDVARAVSDGTVDLGLLPIENTLAGSVHASYDAILSEPDIVAIAEVVLPIHHCILAVPGATLEMLRSVESHPVALAQCGEWFQRHPAIEARSAYDTAGAAATIARVGDPKRGALASRAAAKRYGLSVLAESVEDRDDNQTRFLLLSRTPADIERNSPVRTMLVAATPNKPGALLRLLAPLAENGLNMVKLESRPTGTPWTYLFVLEFEHRFGDARAATAIAAIRATATSLRVVGTYQPDGA